MSKENLDQSDLTAGDAVEVATKVAKEKKVQTPEEAATLVAGVAQMRTIGVSENLGKVLELVSAWNGEKVDLVAVKEEVIKSFGTSEELKNYIDGDFQNDVQAWVGLAKAIPVLNNIKSFYARRENTSSTKKVKLQQISIAGEIYNVDAAYLESIKAEPTDVRRELILAHPVTAKVEVAELF